MLKDLMATLAATKRKLDTVESKYKAAKQAYDDAREAVLGELNSQQLESARHGRVTATVQKRNVFTVTDWDKFYQYIARYKAYDLLQRRPAVGAIVDRLEDGKRVPGKLEKIRILTVKVK